MLRLILVLYMLYVVAFVVTAALMYFDRMGFDPGSVVHYYLGDPGEEFGQPARPYSAMIQDAHMHMFAMGMLVLVLTHLLLFVPVANAIKFWLTSISFGATLMNEVSNWLVRFASAKLAVVKIASFVVMELSLVALTVLLIAYVSRPGKNAYKQTNDSNWNQG